MLIERKIQADEEVKKRLTLCAECDHRVSRTASSCPSCGAVLNAPVRGVLIFCLLAALSFVLIGLFTMYQPSTLLGGDAYNYIVAADRGIGLICVGITFSIIGVVVQVARSR